MSTVKEVFSILAARAEEAIPVHDNDYLGEDGLLICGKCHTPKQCRPFPGSDLAVYCLCKCQQEEDRLMQERLRRNQTEHRRAICFGASDLIHAFFAEDDGKNPKLTEVCRTFAENLTGLLVIDDFGCERRTDYMDEIRFNLIDGRLRSGKPCVITTNLTLHDFAAPADLTQKRIISRIFERAKTFHVQGDDRRFSALKSRAEQSSSGEK